MNDGRVGGEHRFGYFAIVDGDLATGVRKHDLTTGRTTDHLYGAGRFGGEAVFVARPGATEEDDGVEPVGEAPQMAPLAARQPAQPASASRLRCRRTRARLPQTRVSHQRRLRLRLVSA